VPVDDKGSDCPGSCAAGLKAGVPIAAERRPKGVSLWDYGPKCPFGVRFEERSDSPSTAPAKRLDIRGYELRAIGGLESRDGDAVSSDGPFGLMAAASFVLPTRWRFARTDGCTRNARLCEADC